MTKVAYITRGSKGIGLGIAEAMLKEGMHVAITGRTIETLDQAAKKLSHIETGQLLTIQADVRNIEEEQKAVDSAVEEFGPIGICIANAGVGYFGSIEDLTKEQWDNVIDINLTGVFHTVKACIPSLKKTQGYIITIASLAGTNFFKNGSAYNASKFGLVGFTQAVMLDLREFGIKVTTIMPGSVSTFFNNRTPNESEAWKIQPEDIGQIVMDLLRMNPRTLPSKIEVRPSIPPSKK